MNLVIRTIVAFATGAGVFWAVYYTHHAWFAVVLGLGTAAFVGLVQMVEFTKKLLETYKVWLEVLTTRKAERDRERIVQLASSEDIKEYAQSPVERILKDRYTKTGQYFLEPRRFVADCREEKRPSSQR